MNHVTLVKHSFKHFQLIFTQYLHSSFEKASYSVCTMFAQCLHNVCTMFAQFLQTTVVETNQK